MKKNPILFCITVLLVTPLTFANTTPITETLKICALYPHLKDAYWLAVNYGMIEAAKKHPIELKILEAGGYDQQKRQTEQWQTCLDWEADAILLATMPHIDWFKTSIPPIFTLVNPLTASSEIGRAHV